MSQINKNRLSNVLEVYIHTDYSRNPYCHETKLCKTRLWNIVTDILFQLVKSEYVLKGNNISLQGPWYRFDTDLNLLFLFTHFNNLNFSKFKFDGPARWYSFCYLTEDSRLQLCQSGWQVSVIHIVQICKRNSRWIAILHQLHDACHAWTFQLWQNWTSLKLVIHHFLVWFDTSYEICALQR